MARKSLGTFSLSLLDLLFCAFGGVIVLSVIFTTMIKSTGVIEGKKFFYAEAEVVQKEGDHYIAHNPDAFGFSLLPVPGLLSRTSALSRDTVIENIGTFSLFHSGFSLNNGTTTGRLSGYDIVQDNVKLYVSMSEARNPDRFLRLIVNKNGLYDTAYYAIDTARLVNFQMEMIINVNLEE